MKKILKSLLCLPILSASVLFAGDNISNPVYRVAQNGPSNCCLGPCDGSPFLLIRSQGRDGVRDLVGWQQFINKYEMQGLYGAFAITPGYSRSMKPDSIAQFYFGDQLEGCNKLLIQGTAVSPRHPKAWVADYFGLPTDYSSVIKFNPRLDNFMVDLHFYVGLDDFLKGTYFRIHSPLVHTRWNMGTTECIKNHGTDIDLAGYMSDAIITRANLPANLMSVMLGSTTFGDMQSPICYGKFPVCTMDQTKLADIQATLGWNVFQSDDYHFGFFIDGVFPTGTRPSACYLFEPIIGNGHHFEFGAGISSSWIFYRSKDHDDRYLGLWFDATLNHLFGSCQRRSFDFCGKPNSRYALLEEFGAADGHLTANGQAATYQYTGNLLPAINYTTINTKVKIGLQSDLVFKFGYVRDDWNFDFGYNFWARTGESFNCSGCQNGVDAYKYALKGNAFLYGQSGTGPTIEKLSSTESMSTIQDVATIDNPALAYYDQTPINVISTTAQMQTSMPPVFVTRADLNMGKTPSAITHKLFFNMEHAWKGQEARWLPFLGIGGSVEIAQNTNKDCTCSCCFADNQDNASSPYNNCNPTCGCKCSSWTKNGAISQWGTWVKGGVYFE